ncbi:hypothetical protein KFL_000020660 [Klebsormidium nitens]|uniref:Erythromycin esterase n=1 Tax=Klebsormidium nitens TaxID=105231 RepID=A0A1Y1HGZ5_KLENI|nr:hypothetical protein KFL_000020660 [Klebsormidium nitens]|eukprot:GAQ77705.1 hypothetical protein KFL_000020660 [Klebsormidium nitens]
MEEKIQPHIVLLSGDPKKAYDGLLRDIGDAQVVLIGEASHGTHDFYEERAKITKRLVEEKGFSMVVCEADWPDMARAHRYVRGLKGDGSAAEALEGFKRFPTWMWRNTVMVDFVEWAKKHNQEIFAKERAGEKLENTSTVGLYGFDLYSLHKSMEAVIEYLEKVDPDTAERTKKRYSCFDHFGRDPQLYGLATTAGGADPCEDQVVQVLKDLMRLAPEKLRSANHDRDATCHEDEQFFAVQNALVVKDAEQYYRSMYRARDMSWNLRDKHMFNTLKALIAHCERLSGSPARTVVWAHNSHLGDARATDMSWRRKELNVGQLVREHYKEKAFNIGFSTYTGTVTAAYDWGEPAHCMKVNQGMAGSFERLFHKVSPSRFLLDVSNHVPKHLELLERAIGVIYRADTERFSHYFQARVAQQFNRVIHLDWTRALEPLEWGEKWTMPKDEPPETFPFGE